MKRTFLFCFIIAAAAVILSRVTAAPGDSNDPLASLSYLEGTFTEKMNDQITEKLDASDASLTQEFPSVSGPVAGATSSWEEVRLKAGDSLGASTGTGVLVLAGEVLSSISGGAVIDVTDGNELSDGDVLKTGHRYLAAEDAAASFTVVSKTAVVDHQGPSAFTYSDAVDYNAMAAALKKLHLFKGSFTGYGEGFDLEVSPTRLQALIMFIRVMGEEEAALAWSGPLAFEDLQTGTQAERYVGYAKEKGYTNGYTATEFRGGQKVNAYQYTEFLLRAMGYSSAENTKIGDSLDRAVLSGLLTERDREMLLKDPFLRAELVYLSFNSLDRALSDGSGTLASALIGKGVFTEAEMADAMEMVSDARA